MGRYLLRRQQFEPSIPHQVTDDASAHLSVLRRRVAAERPTLLFASPGGGHRQGVSEWFTPRKMLFDEIGRIP
jgi:hypothetical protein